MIDGSAIVNPARYANRQDSKLTHELGDPYPTMTDSQKVAWRELQQDLPWLNNSHRVIVRIACYWIAKLDDGEDLGVNAITGLSSILSKLGASPVDESKVNHGDGGEEDESDKFFRPN